MNSSPLLANSNYLTSISVQDTSTRDTVNNSGSFTFRSYISTSSYVDIYDQASKINITSENCGYFKNCLPGFNSHSDSTTFGRKGTYHNTYYELVTDYGVNKIYEFMKFAAGGEQYYDGRSGWNAGYWYAKPIGYPTSYTSYPEISFDSPTSNFSSNSGNQGLVKNLPFDTGGYYTTGSNKIDNNEFELNIEYYPVITISNNGKTVTSKTNQVYVICEFDVSGNYSHNRSINSTNSSTNYIGMHIKNDTFEYGSWTPGSNGEVIPTSIHMSLKFDFVINLTNSGIDYDHLNPTILSKIKEFLQNMDYSVFSTNQIQFYVEFSGNAYKINGSDITNLGYTTFTKNYFNQKY